MKIVPLKILEFQSPKALRDWFSLYHDIEFEIWVKIYKKHTNILSVTWNDVVLECLCWGWIDSTKKSLDDESYLQRITPRKENSVWSKKNTENVEFLIKEKRMTEFGLLHVNAAKKDGRWQNAYSHSNNVVPLDFQEALNKNLSAKLFFEKLPKYKKNIIIWGLNSAKRKDTRQKRFEKFLNQLINQEKPN